MSQLVSSLVGFEDDGCGGELLRKLMWLPAGGLLLIRPWQGEGKEKKAEEEKRQEVRSNFTGDAAATVESGRLQAHGPGNGTSKADSLHLAENCRLLARHEPQGAGRYCVQSAGTRGTNRSAGVVQARS